jgi:predicted homoserine dehydrogenase-like protein
MIIVDRALKQREADGQPIRVGFFGAGVMARGLAAQINRSVPGMMVSAICNRTLQRAADAYQFSGSSAPISVTTQNQLDDAIRQHHPAITDDPQLLAGSEELDCLVDLTGSVDYGAEVAKLSIARGKHLVLMNAEVDATIGPILHAQARQSGSILSCADGDQPGVQMNLYRYVKSLGFIPRVLGNIKGLQDESRNPTTQADFARMWNQNLTMVTSFADGSKVNFEQCIVANATGFTTAQRGMLRMHHDGHVDELTTRYDLDELRRLGGIVDCVIGARPSPGVYCLAELQDHGQARYLELFKMGCGPLYSFYQPYHLCHLETPLTIARIVLFGDSCGQPVAGPALEVVALAKRDLRAGETLDSYGQYMTYGQVERATCVREQNLIPQGLVEGCLLLTDVPQGSPLRWQNVKPASDKLSHQLYAEQNKMFRS